MVSKMKVFFDCEFTGLHQHTTLISLGCVAENGMQFYAEATDYDRGQVNRWIQENVIDHLFLVPTPDTDLPTITADKIGNVSIIGARFQIAIMFKNWISKFKDVEMWGDVYAYDWVLFCELFDAEDIAERLPRNIYYIPFDLATLMKIKGIDPDISREEFSGIENLAKHNALDDARIIKACYEKLQGS
jgi:hypothetical protein